MIWIRNALIGGILVVVFLLFIRWSEYQDALIAAEAPYQENVQDISDSGDIPDQPESDNHQSSSDDADLPTASATSKSDKLSEPVLQKPSSTSKLIKVKTDTLDLVIDPKGGDIVRLSLPQYLSSIDDKESAFSLLNQSRSHTYIAQSDLFGTNGTHTKDGRATYRSVSSSYEMREGDDTLTVDLTFVQDRVNIIKRFTFTRDSYLVGITYLVDNQSSQTWKAAMYGRIKRDDYTPPSDTGFGMQPFVGAAITTPETNYKKFDFDEIDDLNRKSGGENVEQKGGWVAMIQHYFVSAWIPNPEQNNNFTLKKSSDKVHYLFGYTSPTVSVQAGERGEISSSFYAGPKIIKKLEKISPHLDLTIDFSWLWFIAKPLFLALDFIHGFVNNWGVAIILLTCLVKLIFFYPSAMSYRSMAKMRKVMPKMQELKERYGDDRQKMGAETMKLYKKEGVNPVGGCLPMLMQMPVFIALYWALMESVELRHSPFYLWIQDLSVKDPYFVLPLIFGVSMYFQQKLNPAPADPMQAKIMQMMPIFFTFLFMMFPSGLVLYWVTNNILSIAQQYVITKNIEKEG